jgi:hypothetical protein
VRASTRGRSFERVLTQTAYNRRDGEAMHGSERTHGLVKGQTDPLMTAGVNRLADAAIILLVICTHGMPRL